MRVVHAYPGHAAYVQEVLLGLQEGGHDLDVYTTVTGRADRAWEAAAAARLARRWPRVRDYMFPAGPRTRFHRRPGWDVVRVAGQRLGGRAAVDAIWEVKSREYDRWVARNLTPDVDAVVGYEHSCLLTFRRAKALGVKAIYHMVAPHHEVSHAILQAQVSRCPEVRSTFDRGTRKERRRERHKNLEYDAADGFMTISSYVAKSVTDLGYPADRVAVVPFGAPPADPGWRDVPRTGPVTFLFAGSLNLRKGVPQLLRVWRRARPADARLWLAGRWAFDPPSEWRGLPGVEELGNLDHRTLFQKYREADVFVFPTLCDGFGMVVTEALANGLPVVTTTSAGAADLIRDGENGWVIPPDDEAALAAVLTACTENPDQVRAMRAAAMAAAAARPWTTYRRDFVAALADLIDRLG